MGFELEKLFGDVFAPQSGDVVTIMYDLPHGEIRDHKEWQERRKMADEWHRQIVGFSKRYGVLVNPTVTYDATGSHNADMPEYGMCRGERVRFEDIFRDSTIVISMPQFSAWHHLSDSQGSTRTCEWRACRWPRNRWKRRGFPPTTSRWMQRVPG